jgi:hypothetical protein
VTGPRPAVAGVLVAEVTDRLPARLRRRLEEHRDLAEEWTWSRAGQEVVVTAAGAVVRVTSEAGEVRDLDHVACDCLLSPRCLHVAAVLLALPLAVESGSPPDGEAGSSRPAGDTVPVGAGARAAAEAGRHACELLLDIGATSAGLVVQGELLRAAHACRLAGLHRTGAALTRTVRRLAELHGERPEYRLDQLVGDVSDALISALAVAGAAEGGTVPRSAVGVARRAYEPVGSRRLAGLLTEAVTSAAGLAGVVTHLVDQEARPWTVADVVPGEAERVAAAYGAPVELGDLVLSHRELGRSAVYVQRATGSADGRLGAGGGVGAVRAGDAGWESEPLSALWARPLAEQLDAVFAALAVDRTLRRAGWDLLFLDGVVVGVRQAALVLATEAGDVGCYAPGDHEALPYRRNLRLLGAAPGLRLRVVGRVLTERVRAIALLAAGPAPAAAGADADAGPPDEPEPSLRLRLPPEWLGRANLGVDALQSAHLTGAERAAVELPAGSGSAPPDPLDAVGRRLGQALTGGRATQAETAWADIDREAALLRRRQMGGAAARLEALRAASVRGLPDGRRRFALAWAAARTYQVVARNRLSRTGWT